MKPITVTVDYMRGGTPRDTFASAEIQRLGKPHRQCRGDRLADRAVEADRRRATQFPARPHRAPKEPAG